MIRILTILFIKGHLHPSMKESYLWILELSSIKGERERL